MLKQLRYTASLFLLLFVTTLSAQIAVPALSRHVTDLTTTLTIEQTTALENKLTAFETQKGSQIAILILPTTQPEDIAAFGIRVADTWKIGRKSVDDGIILIVAKEDRKVRIEVGRGLEGAIPDATAKRVIEEIITPKFKANDFSGGIDAGVSQLIKLIEGESLPEPSPTTNSSQNTISDALFSIALFIAFFCFALLDISFSERFGTIIGTLLTGITTGIIGTIYSLFFNPDVYAALFVGGCAFIAGLVASCMFKTHGTLSSSSSSASGSSAWSSSDSSWSGGGGGFSGGGASGSW